MKTWLALSLPLLALGASAPVLAGETANKPSEEEIQRARDELVRARDELRRAAEQLARLTSEYDKDSPRARAWEYMTNPRRAMLGVSISDGPEKNGELRGVLITGVTPGSGADKAGLKSGDLLLTANGRKLSTPAKEHGGPELRLRDLMRELKPGDQVKLDYEREGRTATATVIASRAEDVYMPMLGWKDDDDHDVLVPPVPPLPPIPPMAVRVHDRSMDLGMELARLDGDLGPYFHTDKGVLVVSAPRSGSLGLKSGDVIQLVDGKPVTSPVEVWDLLNDAGPGAKVSVDVVRQGRTMNLEGTLPERDRSIRKRIEIESGEDR